MAISAVNNQTTIEQIIESTTGAKNTRKTGELGKDDFLNLLVTQLRYQDPLQPVDDKEFISQMAQFSSLEQMQNMNTSLTSVKAFSLIGRRISADIVDKATGKTETVEGDVTSVKVNRGRTYVVVRGREIPVEDITDITESYRTSQSSLTVYTGLIGLAAGGAVYDPYTGEIVEVKGTVKAIQKGLYEDYAVMDGVSVEIAEIVTDNPSSDPEFIKNYLEAHDGGGDVDVVIVDRDSGQRVPVRAKLREFTIENGTITAVLDQLNVPVESIVKIEPQKQQEEAL